MLPKEIDFTNLVEVPQETGAGLDLRHEEEKKKDWRPEEAFAFANPVIWRKKTIEEIEAEIKATSINQNYTLRCVSEYGGISLQWAEFLETGRHIVFSRRDIYRRRANYPTGGMNMPDLFRILKEGACYENQLPSTAVYETEINKDYIVSAEMKKARAIHAQLGSFIFEDIDIEKIAQTIQSGTPVCLFWYFKNIDNMGYQEWWRFYPRVVDASTDLYAKTTGRHQASGVSFTLNDDGEKCIAVMDSAGWGTGLGTNKNIRLVNDKMLKARCYGAGFVIDKKNLDLTIDEKPRFNFKRSLRYGDVGPDVKALQKILVYEKVLVLKDLTENFKGMTQGAVKKLQEKYADKILKPAGLKIGTGFVGENTLKWLKENYSVL